MFDWPEHKNTSPTRMSVMDWLAPDCVRTLSEYGPPAGIAGSSALPMTATRLRAPRPSWRRSKR